MEAGGFHAADVGRVVLPCIRRFPPKDRLCFPVRCASWTIFLLGSLFLESSIPRSRPILPWPPGEDRKAFLGSLRRESIVKRDRPRFTPIRLSTKLYAHVRQQVLTRDNWRCQVCGTICNLEAHHQQFRSNSGEDSEQNLITRRRKQSFHLSESAYTTLRGRHLFASSPETSLEWKVRISAGSLREPRWKDH